MPSIGPITIPAPVDAGTWPLLQDHGSSVVIQPRIAEHRFWAANSKRAQRFLLTPPLRQFRFVKSLITRSEMDSLQAFWETAMGPYSIFDYVHRSNTGADTFKVRFADQAISWEFLTSCLSRTGIGLVEVQTATPTYTVAATLDRFPSGALNTALLEQVQEVIPLVRLRVTDASIDDIFLSDRLCVVGGDRYEPRILQSSGISQRIGESSDQASFTLGNADDVFTDLVAAVDLSLARLEFGLYHVQTGIKIDLWTGFLATDGAWSLNDQDATMEIRATDGLATTTAAYPVRGIAQSCWKELDGPYCPVSTAGTNTGTPCDKGYDTAAGCKFHSMDEYFGGIVVKQQLVQLTANSFFGTRNARLSASSIINDAATGRPLKEVYTDIDLPVPCDVIAGRDESEYRSGLGIVGAGPIGAFSDDLTLQTLDNVGPHGGNTGLGFRSIKGTDPITDTVKERMGLDEAAHGWNAPPDSPYAAGVAAIQVRRTDEKGIQGFRVSDWQMSSSVSQGLGGWKWTAVGTRTWVTGLTNPVWIAVNGWLKVNGVWCDNTHTTAINVSLMEQFVDVDACIASAAICDAPVDTLIGSGSETQFKFCGIIGDFKPFRQWLQILLDGALCDYTFRNAKLRISARVNASAASAFGQGNTIFRSLRTEMRAPRFNHLTVEFGDQEYKFERNGVSLYDETHAKRRAPAGAMPAYTKQTMSPAGVTRKSQAARLNITLLREELGGLTEAEQRSARNVTWQTTILALEVEPGMVVSLNGLPKIPDGTKVRVTGWSLNPDFSITLSGSTVVASMYDYAIGPKPEDVAYGPADRERAPAIKYRRWFPGTATADSNDPTLDENDLSFSAGISYEDYKDGSKRAVLNVQGRPHVNSPLLVDPPQVRTIAFASTGGQLEGTHPLYVCIAPYDATGRLGPRSRTIAIHLDAATSTCTATLSNITWPAGTWTGYRLYAGREERAMCLQQTATGTPSSITIAGPSKRATEGPPEAADLGYRLKAKELLVPGAVKAIVTSLPSTTAAICSALAGSSIDYTGENVMVIGDASEGFPPLRTWTVTAFNATTGEFTFERTHAGTDPLQTGDTILVLARATSSSSTTVACSHLALAADDYKGATVRIIYGQGAGQFRRIVSNDGTTLTVDSAWDSAPPSTAFFVVETADWQYSSDVTTPNIAASDEVVSLNVPVENLEGRTLLAMGFLVDSQGSIGFEDNAPFRIVEIVGAEGVAPGNDPPGPIRDFAVVSIDGSSDPSSLLVTVSFKPPSTPNNFEFVRGWLLVGSDQFSVGEITHPLGSAGDGSGVFRIAKPTGSAWVDVLLFGVSASATFDNSLVTASGPGQTPNVSLGTIDPYEVGSAPPAPNFDSVSASIEYDGDKWRAVGTAVFPSSGRELIGTFSLRIRGPWTGSPATPDRDQSFSGDVVPPPTGDYEFATEWWERPVGGNEIFTIDGPVRSASGGITSDPTTTGNLTVTPAPTQANLTSVAGSIIPNGVAQWGVEYTIGLPADRTRIAVLDVYLTRDPGGADEWRQLIARPIVPSSGSMVEQTDVTWERPTATETYRVEAQITDVYGNQLAFVVSSTFNLTARPVQANLTGLTGGAFTNGELGWGVNWSVALPADRSLIKRLILWIVQVGSDYREVMAGPIVPLSGPLADVTDGLWPRPLVNESYYIESEMEDVYGNILAAVQSSTFVIGPFAWQQVSFGSPTSDYAAVQAAVKVAVNITAPTDPELTAVRLWQKRGSGVPQELGLVPITSAATVPTEFILDLPVGGSQNIDVYAVPVHTSGSTEALRTSGTPHPKITISADPTQQAVQTFEGLLQVTGPFSTINPAIAAPGKMLAIVLTQTTPGGSIPTWGGNFTGQIPPPWPDAASRTGYTFISADFGSGNKWLMISGRQRI